MAVQLFWSLEIVLIPTTRNQSLTDFSHYYVQLYLLVLFFLAVLSYNSLKIRVSNFKVLTGCLLSCIVGLLLLTEEGFRNEGEAVKVW